MIEPMSKPSITGILDTNEDLEMMINDNFIEKLEIDGKMIKNPIEESYLEG